MQVQPVQQVQTSYYRTAYGWTGLSLIEMDSAVVNNPSIPVPAVMPVFIFLLIY